MVMTQREKKDWDETGLLQLLLFVFYKSDYIQYVLEYKR